MLVERSRMLRQMHSWIILVCLLWPTFQQLRSCWKWENHVVLIRLWTGRMRKQVVTLTPSAVERVRELNELNGGRFLRLGTRSAGCSGFKYDFSYSDVQNCADI